LLSPDILTRSFRAASGELGVHPGDATAFLNACEANGIGVVGWELWLVDHVFDAGSRHPRRAAGSWCGLIPLRGGDLPAVIAGSGSLTVTREQIAAIDLDRLLDAPWRADIRIHITLDD
jgi:hypothetical protein